MVDGNYCDICGKASDISVFSEASGSNRNLCFACYNREMAEMFGIDMPGNVPEQLVVNDRGGKPHIFDIEFIIFGTGKSLAATEAGKIKRKADVWGSLDDDFDDMLETLKKRVKKVLSSKYMDKHGKIKDDKIVGYISYDFDLDECVIYVDGKPYTWEELGTNIPSFEGWKIKIEFAGVGDELE